MSNNDYENLNSGANTTLLVSLNKSISAVETSLARLEERVSKALEMHSEVTVLKEKVQMVQLELKAFEERYERERHEAEERIKRTISIAALAASTMGVLTGILTWIVSHYKG